jgi:hypothetical protein
MAMTVILFLISNVRNHLPTVQLAPNFPARKDLVLPPKKRQGSWVSVNCIVSRYDL